MPAAKHSETPGESGGSKEKKALQKQIVHLFVFQSFALTIETPCVWVENRRRDANGVQILGSDSVRWKYHYEGEMTGSFSVLATRLRPTVEREREDQLKSLSQQLFCFPSRRTTFSAGRNPMSGSGAEGQSIAD